MKNLLDADCNIPRDQAIDKANFGIAIYHIPANDPSRDLRRWVELQGPSSEIYQELTRVITKLSGLITDLPSQGSLGVTERVSGDTRKILLDSTFSTIFDRCIRAKGYHGLDIKSDGEEQITITVQKTN